MLVVRDSKGGVQISAVPDFEMALAGDGAVDLAWLYYQDGQSDSELSALLPGYSVTVLEPAMEQRLLLYQLSYAFEHVWWKVEFCERAGIEHVRRRIWTLLDGVLCHSRGDSSASTANLDSVIQKTNQQSQSLLAK